MYNALLYLILGVNYREGKKKDNSLLPAVINLSIYFFSFAIGANGNSKRKKNSHSPL